METTNVSKCFSTNKYTDNALATVTQHIIASMTDNGHFLTPDPTLVVMETAYSNFMDATAKAIGGTKQDTADKNAKREVLEDLLRKLADYVQRTSLGVEVTILSSGFDIYKKPEPIGPLPTPQNFHVKPGANRGCVDLCCDAVANADFYEFEFIETAVKDGSVWAKYTSTKKTFTVEGLTSGKEYAFRVAAAGSNPSRQWSPEVTSFVL